MVPNIPDLHPPSSRRRGVMLCYPFEEKRLKKWNTRFVICQPKLDGVRCRVILDNESPDSLPVMLSSEQHLISSTPHIMEELIWLKKRLTSEGISYLELDGELYNPDLSFDEITSITSRTVSLSTEHDLITLQLFDLVNEDNQMARMRQLYDLLHGYSLETIDHVPSTACHGEDEILRALERYLDLGFEGIIIRNPWGHYERKRSMNIMKFKPRKSDIYQIIGFVQERSKTGELRPRLGAWICRAPDNGSTFNVGSGMTQEQRRVFWENRDLFIGQFLMVKYQSLTTKRVPRFPIFSQVLKFDGTPFEV